MPHSDPPGRPGLSRAAALTLLSGLLLGGCAGIDREPPDGGPDRPVDLSQVRDAVPRVEARSRYGNPASYVVHGRRYEVWESAEDHRELGTASWYGSKFHGRRTSSGEPYDMYAMTAAHKTLPLPTYAKVTNVENGRSVVVRVNDRGPFHGRRIIDLSYTAAAKLGVVKKGTAKVEVRAIDPRRYRDDSSPFLAGLPSSESPQQPKATTSAVQPEPERPVPAAATARLEHPPALAQASPAERSAPLPAAAPDTPTRTADQGRTLYLQVGAFGDQANAERLRNRISSRLTSDGIEILEPERSGQAFYKVRVGPLTSDQDAERVSRALAGLGVDSPHRVWN